MDIQAEIAVLVAEADALRPLDDDDTRKIPLGAIVDKINALRAIEAKSGTEGPDVDKPPKEEVKPKRGRPAKTEG